MNLNFSHVDTNNLIMLRNNCVRYKQKLKTKAELYQLFNVYTISNHIDGINYDIDTIPNNIEKVIETIENELFEKCEHEWIQEWIDISIDQSVKVTYCIHCEITKK